jgi:hypothetical protein
MKTGRILAYAANRSSLLCEKEAKFEETNFVKQRLWIGGGEFRSFGNKRVELRVVSPELDF